MITQTISTLEKSIMTKVEFTLDDFGFNDRSDTCWLRFTRRSDGSPRCRLVLSEAASADVGDRVSVAVDEHGNIIVRPGKGDLVVSRDRRASISLDRYARHLLDVNGAFDEVECDAIVLSGCHTVVLRPSNGDFTR